MTYAKARPKKYECSYCCKRFLGSSDLRKHVRIHTGEKPFICFECNKGFRQAVSLKNHIVSKHSPGVQNEEVYVCDICNKVFPIRERLRLHQRIHTGYKPYECNICEKTFARSSQLTQHLRTHLNDKPFSCHVCEAKFTSTANLRLHMKRHLDLRDFVCDICGKSFYRRDALTKHLNCYHKNLKAFHCKVCNKYFKGHLPQHMRTHKNEKPHGCAHCGAAFAQRSQLTVHQRIHSGEKPYRCQVCWKAFAYSTALKLHKRFHTGEKPFVCILCKASFSQLPHLKKHMLCVHKSDKPYVCDHCHSFHKTKSELEIHYLKCRKLIRKQKVEPKIKNDDIDPPMEIPKMRFLLAILLKKISSPERLVELGFNKRLIDDVLIESIKSSGREPCDNDSLSEAERLKKNVQILLEWTVPKHYMEKFQTEQRSTEELLEELTS